jgi:hypothetical protein
MEPKVKGVQETCLNDVELVRDMDTLMTQKLGTFGLIAGIIFRVLNNIATCLYGIERVVRRRPPPARHATQRSIDEIPFAGIEGEEDRDMEEQIREYFQQQQQTQQSASPKGKNNAPPLDPEAQRQLQNLQAQIDSEPGEPRGQPGPTNPKKRQSTVPTHGASGGGKRPRHT